MYGVAENRRTCDLNVTDSRSRPLAPRNTCIRCVIVLYYCVVLYYETLY